MAAAVDASVDSVEQAGMSDSSSGSRGLDRSRSGERGGNSHLRAPAPGPSTAADVPSTGQTPAGSKVEESSRDNSEGLVVDIVGAGVPFRATQCGDGVTPEVTRRG